MNNICSNPDQSSRNKDTGIVLALIISLYGYISSGETIILPIIAVLAVTVTFPVVFTIPAKIWFGFSELTGTVMSKVILTIIFFLLITPIGLIRRMFKADPLQLNLWKKDNTSVFHQQRRQIVAKDLELPY